MNIKIKYNTPKTRRLEKAYEHPVGYDVFAESMEYYVKHKTWKVNYVDSKDLFPELTDIEVKFNSIELEEVLNSSTSFFVKDLEELTTKVGNIFANQKEPLHHVFQINAVKYNTGICMEIPSTHWCDVRARSSVYKKDLILANGCGVGDPDYRGQYAFIYKLTDNVEAMITQEPNDNPLIAAEFIVTGLEEYLNELDIYDINANEAVGQFIIQNKLEVDFQEVNALSTSDRGDGGFGSSTK